MVLFNRSARAKYNVGKLAVPNQAFSLWSQLGSKNMQSNVSCRQKTIKSLDVLRSGERLPTRAAGISRPMLVSGASK